jgi:hypothetical protein
MTKTEEFGFASLQSTAISVINLSALADPRQHCQSLAPAGTDAVGTKHFAVVVPMNRRAAD